jgi:hypothetical protein
MQCNARKHAPGDRDNSYKRQKGNEEDNRGRNGKFHRQSQTVGGLTAEEKHGANVKSESCYLWTLLRTNRHWIEIVEGWGRGAGNDEILSGLLCDYSSSGCFA